jgi:hypothetical protein
MTPLSGGLHMNAKEKQLAEQRKARENLARMHFQLAAITGNVKKHVAQAVEYRTNG